MSFSIATASQLAALRSEIANDPRGYGLKPLAAASDDAGLVAALNLPRDGTAGTVPTTPTAAGGLASGIIQVNRGTISTQELLEGIVQSDFAALTQGQRDWIIAVAGGTRVRVDTGSTARAGLLALFGAGTTTRTNLTASAQQVGSRAEELFGVGTMLQIADVSQAR